MKLRHLLPVMLCLSASIALAHNEGSTLTEHHEARATNACSTDADCSGHGVCTAGACVCDSGYATLKSGARACAYQEKKQLTAFLLHFFLGFYGAGEFYVGNIGTAAAQLALGAVSTGAGLVSALGGCCGSACSLAGRNLESGTCTALGCATVSTFSLIGFVGMGAFLADFGMWVWDNVEFGKNWKKDSHGKNLEPW